MKMFMMIYEPDPCEKKLQNNLNPLQRSKNITFKISFPIKFPIFRVKPFVGSGGSSALRLPASRRRCGGHDASSASSSILRSPLSCRPRRSNSDFRVQPRTCDPLKNRGATTVRTKSVSSITFYSFCCRSCF